MRVFSISLALSCALLTAYGSPTRAAEPQAQQTAVEAKDFAIETQEEEVLLRKARNEEMTQRIEGDPATAVPVVPSMTLLRQNHPNPFNPATTIAFDLRESGPVDLRIYDVAGRQVRTMVQGRRNAGRHSVLWNGLDDRGLQVASGVYLYRLVTREHTQTRRMTLLK